VSDASNQRAPTGGLNEQHECERDVVMPTAKSTALEVIESELALQLPVHLLGGVEIPRAAFNRPCRAWLARGQGVESPPSHVETAPVRSSAPLKALGLERRMLAR
jgi:hypothetical protein